MQSPRSSFPLSAVTVALASIWVVLGLPLGGCSQSDTHYAEKAAPAKGADKHGAGKADHSKEEPGHDDKAIKLSDEERKTAGMRVEPTREQEVADQVVVTATIQANQNRLARLAPRVPGRVVKVVAQLGDRVQAGQVLAHLDSIEVGEARSAYVQAASEAQVAKASLDRAERLQAEQIVSQKDLLRARAEYEKARAALRASADKVQMLGLSRRGATDGVSVFPLTAPFAGTVIEKKAVLGELSQPDKPLFVIADLSTLWIEADLREKDLARIKTGDEAVVSVEAYPNERFQGRLTYIGGTLDKDTRMIHGRIEVNNADGRLKPEMFASVAIQTVNRAKAMVLPDEAVVIVAGQPIVFVEEHGGFEPRVVELGSRLQGRVIVKAGLKPDDLVVVAGTYALKARLLKSQIGAGHAH